MMKTYKVEITETLQTIVEVQAESRAEAEQMAEDGWKEERFVLGAESFMDVSFCAQSQRGQWEPVR